MLTLRDVRNELADLPAHPNAAHTPTLCERYRAVRATTMELFAPLSEEDAQVQSMPDASPVKWHLAHTTWFFETFALALGRDYTCVDPSYGYLFNSYYEAVGPRVERARRGLLTRPSLRAVLDYRRIVDERVEALLTRSPSPELAARVELGLAHEQQHQELLLMDVKHLLGHQPLTPAYRAAPSSEARAGSGADVAVGSEGGGYVRYAGGLISVGYDVRQFCFDNETPAHVEFVPPFELASRLVTQREYLAFIADGGYERPELWLSDGLQWLTENSVRMPLYWRGSPEDGARGELEVFTLNGLCPLELDEPVCHVSYYEANAYATWVGARLPTEPQWECAARAAPVVGNFLESRRLRPAAANGQSQLFGDVWEWTQSAYAPYPGYRPSAGALGEYNGKFMCNQMVLKGGSCVTPRDHMRASYRNFFAPHCRWQFSGIRLARDV